MISSKAIEKLEAARRAMLECYDALLELETYEAIKHGIEIRNAARMIEQWIYELNCGATGPNDLGDSGAIEMRNRLKDATVLIERAVEIMTPEQVSQWEGVRAWQENE